MKNIIKETRKSITIDSFKPLNFKSNLENNSYSIILDSKNALFYWVEGTSFSRDSENHPLSIFVKDNGISALFIAKIQLRSAAFSPYLPTSSALRHLLQRYPDAFSMFSIAYGCDDEPLWDIGDNYIDPQNNLLQQLIRTRDVASKPRFKRNSKLLNIPLFALPAEFGVYAKDINTNISKSLPNKSYRYVSRWLSFISRIMIKNCLK